MVHGIAHGLQRGPQIRSDPLHIVLHPLLCVGEFEPAGDRVNRVDTLFGEPVECALGPRQIEDPTGILFLRAMIPERTDIRSVAVMARIHIRSSRFHQHRFHGQESLGYFGKTRQDGDGQVLLDEQPIQVYLAAFIHIGAIQVQQGDALKTQPGSHRHVRLDGQIV